MARQEVVHQLYFQNVQRTGFKTLVLRPCIICSCVREDAVLLHFVNTDKKLSDCSQIIGNKNIVPKKRQGQSVGTAALLGSA